MKSISIRRPGISVQHVLFLAIVMWSRGIPICPGQSLNDSAVLKHRLSLLPYQERMLQTTSNGVTQIHVAIGSWNTWIPQAGVLLPIEEQAQAKDLTIKIFNEQSSIRMVLFSESKEEDQPANPLAVLARYGLTSDRYRLIFHLIDLPTSSVLTTVDVTGSTLDATIRDAAVGIDRALTRLPWHARVIDVVDGLAVLDRGRLDGLRAGQNLKAHRVAPEKIKSTKDPELLLFAGSTELGMCRIEEVSGNYAKARLKDRAAAFQQDDRVVLPEIVLEDRQPRSRARSVWDSLYDAGEN